MIEVWALEAKYDFKIRILSSPEPYSCATNSWGVELDKSWLSTWKLRL